MKASDTRKSIVEELKGTASEVISQIRKFIREGNARRLIIESKSGKVLFQTQLTAGVAGSALVTAMAPVISAIGMFALFMNDVKIIVEKYPPDETGEDEYEVEAEAEVIEVLDEDEDEEEEADEPKAEKKSKEETEKTVGKKKGDK